MNTEIDRQTQAQRVVYGFNQGWRFHPGDSEQFCSENLDDASWAEVCLPHANQILPHKDFNVLEYQFVSWYRKTFSLPSVADNERVSIRFEGVMSVASVYVNGVLVGTHEGGYTPFEFDITNALVAGDQQLVAVRVDSTRHPDIPPEGFIVDYMLFGGMYRTVSLQVYRDVHIRDTFLYTETIEENGHGAYLRGTTVIQNESKSDQRVRLTVSLQKGPKDHETVSDWVTVPANGEITVNSNSYIEHPELWTVEKPNLYLATVTLLCEDEESPGHLVVDERCFQFGVRTVAVQPDGLVLSGQPVKLRGLNRHQTYPYIGNAAPARLQRRDAEILKYELGLNYVRTSHYPQDPAFLDACDELGLLVFTELPGWQHLGDEEWKHKAVQHLEELILRDRNHASVFMWGVRINESQDDHQLYSLTNDLAHRLDPSRPTGGVRNFRQSEFLEDVFTLNDFSMGVFPSVHKPQLITEFLGHMYPTKSMDTENRLSQHALYHAEIVNTVYSRDDIMGASGWCAFDYNTHEHFGPGDMVCYHGVMDMFRQPKFAAKFYQSQRDISEGPVLFAATYLTFATPEHTELLRNVNLDTMERELKSPAYTVPIYIYTNCDTVAVELNGKSLGLARDVATLSSLPHPPKVCEVFAYRVFGELKLTGYDKDGNCVATQVVTTPLGAEQLILQTGTQALVADGSDMTQITVTAVDKNGMRCPYANRAITFDIAGEGVLVGENPVALEAGVIGVYLKSTVRPGKIFVTVKAYGLPEATVEITSVPSDVSSL